MTAQLVATANPVALPPLGDSGQVELSGAIGGMRDFVTRSDNVRSTRSWRLMFLAILNLADIVTTAAVLEAGGGEMNPILAPIVQSIWVPLLFKAMVLSIIWISLTQCSIRSRSAAVMLNGTVALYGMIVGWNFVTLMTH